MTKFDRQEQKLLAVWALKCASRILPIFEEKYPEDDRPGIALETLGKWTKTGEFKMPVIRSASLDSHAAARKAKEDGNDNACFAARAAGQAVATAHVPEHAFGAAYYSLKIAESNLENPEEKIANEFKWQNQTIPKSLKEKWYDWQSERLPKKLRAEWENFLYPTPQNSR